MINYDDEKIWQKSSTGMYHNGSCNGRMIRPLYLTGKKISINEIKNMKGAQKQVAQHTKKAYLAYCQELLASISSMIESSRAYYAARNKESETPFVPAPKRKIVTAMLESFLADLERHAGSSHRGGGHRDCQRHSGRSGKCSWHCPFLGRSTGALQIGRAHV